MILRAKLRDGRMLEIPGVRMHPAFDRMTAIPGCKEHVPAGLYVVEDELLKYLKKHIDEKASRQLIYEIDSAETQFKVYIQTEDHQPYRHYGTLVKEVLSMNVDERLIALKFIP